MIVYNTTFHIDEEVAEEVLSYLRHQFIPDSIADGLLRQPRLLKLNQVNADEGLNVALQFDVKDMLTLNRWLSGQGAAVRKAFVNSFGHKVVGFSTVMEEMALEEES
jgi:hypothetical protein